MTVPMSMSPRGAHEDVAKVQCNVIERRCNVLRQDNQKLLHRIYQVKRLTRMRKREVKFLMSRLDMHGDNFRAATFEEPEIRTPRTSSGKHSKPSAATTQGNSAPPPRRPTAKRKPQQPKVEKPDRDAPRKSNPFLYQPGYEQKPLVIAERRCDARKLETTKQLAMRWRNVDVDKKPFSTSG